MAADEVPADEVPADSGPDSPKRRFAALFKRHVDGRTRPTGATREYRSDRTNLRIALGLGDNNNIRQYLEGMTLLPEYHLAKTLDFLFGDDPKLQAQRAEFLRSWEDAARIMRASHLPATLPRLTPHFDGRDTDIGTILDALLSAPASVAVMIQGPPGIGKSELTKAVAHHERVVARFGAKRWFVRLELATTAQAMQDEILRALNVEPAQGLQAGLASLAGQPCLLVLDNLETPWDGSEAQRSAVEETLANLVATPGLAVLASFRGRDRVGGVAWALTHPVAQLPRQVARTLFCRVAGSEFADDDPWLAHFMERLGGVPLAIELVAGRAYGYCDLEPLWEEWQRLTSKFASHYDSENRRNSSLFYSIELSLRSTRLTEDARRLFGLLGHFPAGFSMRDRDALVPDGGFDAQDRLRRIGLAIERDGRIDLLPPIRDHARVHHRLDEPPLLTAASHFLALVQDLGEKVGSDGGGAVLPRLEAEFGNIEAAFRAMIEGGRSQEAMHSLTGFDRLTYFTGSWSSVLRELADARHRDGDVKGEANCIQSLGHIALARTDHDAAKDAYEQALPLYRRCEDVRGEANCIKSLGNIALARTDHDAAKRDYEQALSLYRRCGGVLGEANCIKSLGDIALRRTDHDAAREAYEQALPLYRHCGSVLGEANCIQSLGDIALRRTDHDVAKDAYQQALPLYRRCGSVLGEANCIKSLGDIALRRTDHDDAKDAYEQALPLYRRCGSVLGEANCIQSLGDIALARTDYDDAKDAYEQALPLYRRCGSVLGEANCIKRLGDIALARTDRAAAKRGYEQALPLYRRSGNALAIAECEEALRRLTR